MVFFFLPVGKAKVLRRCLCLFARLCVSVRTCSVKWTWKSRCNWVWKKGNLVVSLAKLDQTNLLLSISSTDNRHIVLTQGCYYVFDQVGLHEIGDADDDDEIMITSLPLLAWGPHLAIRLLPASLNQFTHSHTKTHTRKKVSKRVWVLWCLVSLQWLSESSGSMSQAVNH